MCVCCSRLLLVTPQSHHARLLHSRVTAPLLASLFARRAFDSLTYRLQLHATVFGIGAYAWTSAAVAKTWEGVLSVFGEALFD